MNSFITRIQLHYCPLKPLRWAFLLPSPISRYKTEIQAISHLPKGTRGGRGQVVSDHCLLTLKSKHDRAREINSPKEKASIIVHFTLEKEKKEQSGKGELACLFHWSWNVLGFSHTAPSLLRSALITLCGFSCMYSQGLPTQMSPVLTSSLTLMPTEGLHFLV